MKKQEKYKNCILQKGVPFCTFYVCVIFLVFYNKYIEFATILPNFLHFSINLFSIITTFPKGTLFG